MDDSILRYSADMLLAQLVQASQEVSETSKRLKKTDLLATLLRQMTPQEVDVAVPFLSGRARQGRIGIGYATVQGLSGSPAESASLQLLEVDGLLEQLSTLSGAGSAARRAQLLASFFQRATESEQRFLRHLLVGELRQGALEGIMVDAVARASGIALERVRRAAMLAGDLAPVARVALEEGESGLARYDVQLFRPLQPMLAGTAEGVEEALQELGEAALEYKLDGARIQVHRSGGDVVVYSRGLNDVSAAVPEVVEAALALPVREVILDGEAIALRPDGRAHPFQVTMRRFGRKLDVEASRAGLPLSPFWFDVMYLDGGSLLDEAQSRRFGMLSAFSPVEQVIPHLTTSNPEAAEGFLAAAFAGGQEGVMAKAPGAPYAAGARGQSWLKIKQAKTLDLAILAAEWGSGRRKGTLSNLHLGARDTVSGGFAMLGKTFKGLTDEMLAWQTQELLKIEVARDRHTVYVEPKIVVEIAFNDIQVSPTYVSGVALRFARVKRYRTDKTAAEADTFQTVQAMALAATGS